MLGLLLRIDLGFWVLFLGGVWDGQNGFYGWTQTR